MSMTIEDIRNLFWFVILFVIPLIAGLFFIIYFGGEVLEKIKNKLKHCCYKNGE